mmetsp:Transcript_28557/g.48534  ORF Transcript_28557/g.48534 Transcript_28557/m.48534 type:complete len:220 (-) Transcript_28557:424-1083(-)
MYLCVLHVRARGPRLQRLFQHPSQQILRQLVRQQSHQLHLLPCRLTLALLPQVRLLTCKPRLHQNHPHSFRPLNPRPNQAQVQQTSQLPDQVHFQQPSHLLNQLPIRLRSPHQHRLRSPQSGQLPDQVHFQQPSHLLNQLPIRLRRPQIGQLPDQVHFQQPSHRLNQLLIRLKSPHQHRQRSPQTGRLHVQLQSHHLSLRPSPLLAQHRSLSQFLSKTV